MQVGVWTDDNDRRRGAAGLTTSAKTGQRMDSMLGKFFTVLFYKKIQTNHFCCI